MRGRAAVPPESQGSLAVAPLIGDQRCYGGTTHVSAGLAGGRSRTASGLEAIERAFDAQARLAHDVRINLGRSDILVAEEFFHVVDVRATTLRSR